MGVPRVSRKNGGVTSVARYFTPSLHFYTDIGIDRLLNCFQESLTRGHIRRIPDSAFPLFTRVARVPIDAVRVKLARARARARAPSNRRRYPRIARCIRRVTSRYANVRNQRNDRAGKRARFRLSPFARLSPDEISGETESG